MCVCVCQHEEREDAAAARAEPSSSSSSSSSGPVSGDHRSTFLQGTGEGTRTPMCVSVCACRKSEDILGGWAGLGFRPGLRVQGRPGSGFGLC